MEFERPPDFKVMLSKTMEMMPVKEDLIHRNPKAFLVSELFKLRVLTNGDIAHTEMLYSVADGKNVLATFEKLKREVIDLQFAAACGPRLKLNPVESYFECVGNRFSSEIKFITKKENFKPVEIHMLLQDQPKSVLSSKASGGKAIRLKIAKKVPSCTRLKDSFTQFMNGGGLLIDFITLSLWPALVIADEQERKDTNVRKEADIKKNQKVGDKTRSDRPRLCSGSDLAPTSAFSNKKDEHRRDSNLAYSNNNTRAHQPNKNFDERCCNTKGQYIPRRNGNSIVSTMIGSKLKNFLASESTAPGGSRFSRNHGSVSIISGFQDHIAGSTVGSFGVPQPEHYQSIPPLFEMSAPYVYHPPNRSDHGRELVAFPHTLPQAQPTFYQDNKSDNEREKRGGRYPPVREIHRGSDNSDWRKPPKNDPYIPTPSSNN